MKLGRSRSSSGLPSRGGSTDSTSNPAPAMRCVVRALASAASSTRLPRAVLMRIALDFIRPNSRVEIMWRVSGVSGACSEITSASRITLSKSVWPSRTAAAFLCSAISTFMPNASAIFCMPWPSEPKPTSPSVLPNKSLTGRVNRQNCSACCHSPAFTSCRQPKRLRRSASIIMNACSGTACTA